MKIDLLGQVGFTGHRQARNGVIMTGQVFCGAVDGDVCSEVQRAQQVRGQERVVGDQQQLMCVADRRQCRNVGKFKQRVGEGLNEQRLGILADGFLDTGSVAGVNVGEFKSVLSENLIKQPAGTAVEIFGYNQMVAGPEEQQNTGNGCHA